MRQIHLAVVLAFVPVAAWAGGAPSPPDDASCTYAASLDDAVRSPQNVCGLTLTAPPGVAFRRLGELRRLTGLSIRYAPGITALPPEIGHLTHLHAVYVLCTPLRAFPRDMTRLPELRTLTVGDDLECQPPDPRHLPWSPELLRSIGRLAHLEDLEISANFDGAPARAFLPLADLKHLRTLRLMLNVRALPEQIFALADLEELDLHFDALQTLPPSIGKLTKLRKLNLCQNRLHHIPREIRQLKQLEELDISNMFDCDSCNQFTPEHLREIHAWLPHTKIIEPDPPEGQH